MAMQVNTENVDRLSDLHDSILSHILSFLSTKEAVGTSVLSTRWRYLFTLVPNIEFEYELCRNKPETDLDFQCNYHPKRSAVNMCFLNQLLFSRKPSLDEFRLRCKGSLDHFHRRCNGSVDSSRVRSWISAAVSCGVKHVDLDISTLYHFTLPAVLFTCGTLVTLKLSMNFSFVFDFPDHVHLPNLKTLHVRSAKFLNDGSVKRLFSRCTSLEDLVLEFCFLENISNFCISHQFLKRLTIFDTLYSYNTRGLITIDAPNLAYLKYHDRLKSGYSLENLQSLIKADILIYSVVQPVESVAAAALFGGICNVHLLILSTTCLELLSSCQPLPVFDSLVKLEICFGRGYKWSSSMDKGLDILLSSLPKLEQLDFDKDCLYFMPEEALSGLLLKCKEIEMSLFLRRV